MKVTFSFIGKEKGNLNQESERSTIEFLIQHGALLGLKDAGLLTESQHRLAENLLCKEYRELLFLTRSGKTYA